MMVDLDRNDILGEVPGCNRSGLFIAGTVMLGQTSQHVVHFPYGFLQGGDHVGPEFGIVRVPPGVAGDQAKLAHPILDVVHDEGEAAVELLETLRSEEHTSELQSLMRTSYAVFCLKKRNAQITSNIKRHITLIATKFN